MGRIALDKRISYLILQMMFIIGMLLFSYYFVWDKQLVKVIIFFVMVTSIILFGYYLNKKFKRDNIDG